MGSRSLTSNEFAAQKKRYVKHLLSICDRFALHPQKLEHHFGLTRGHIHHVDNSFGFALRLPYSTPIQRLYSASSATHPAGSVIGAAGHNAAMRVMKDMGC